MTISQIEDHETQRREFIVVHQTPSYHSLRRYIDVCARSSGQALLFIHNLMMGLKSCSSEVVRVWLLMARMSVPNLYLYQPIQSIKEDGS